MNPKNIHLSDWRRILFGSQPPVFLAEVLLRSIVMYLALLLTLRLMGKRMSGQISITELAVMISLGAVVSLPMQSAQQGVLEGAVLLLLVLAFERGLAIVTFKSSQMEKVVHGRMCILVTDGVLQNSVMNAEQIGKNQLFAMLRAKDVTQLGELERVYLEATGDFSIFSARTPRPGLSTLPEKDHALLKAQDCAEGVYACCYCGTTRTDGMDADACRNCHHREWAGAVT